MKYEIKISGNYVYNKNCNKSIHTIDYHMNIVNNSIKNFTYMNLYFLYIYMNDIYIKYLHTRVYEFTKLKSFICSLFHSK